MQQYPTRHAEEGSRAAWRVTAGRALAGSAFVLLAPLAFPAHAADASINQSGLNGQVQVDQAATSGVAHVLQSGSGNAADVRQTGASASRITIDQSGTGNDLQVRQTQGRLDAVEVVQGGSHNRADLSQTSLGTATTQNLLVLRQAGTGGQAHLHQLAVGATGAIYQSPQSSGAQARLFQAALAPTGVIEQGVQRPGRAPFLDVQAEAAMVRNGQQGSAASAQATASMVQTGGAGLLALIIQGGGAQTASVTQAGAYLEAEIVQSGGAHAASIVQTGAGTASSPYRASVMQFGAQPQTISIQQNAGHGPRVVRVIQQ
ncbi:MAG TPA: hypothetical protein VNB23_04715 [Ramlibacter sp.]|nr:hypothetical protein [Ramlibacter sp.]